jgi:hypothetical protein
MNNTESKTSEAQPRLGGSHERAVRPTEAECVTDSGECEVCRDVEVPIFAGLNENTGEWIGICGVCIAERRDCRSNGRITCEMNND